MRRKQYQRGSVRARWHGRRKVWVGQWREDGRKRSKVFGPCAQLSKADAESMMAQILNVHNTDAVLRPAGALTFGQYLEQVCLPAFRKRWKESTRTTSESDIRRYLIPEFGGDLLPNITRARMQAFLETKAQDLSESIVGHLRWHLNMVFRMAVSDGLVPFSPAEALFTPPCKPSPEKKVMTPEQVRIALSVLDIRERLIFRLAVFEGMRPGEILALCIGKVRPDSLLIDQRVYGSMIDSPKGRKGKRTSRIVATSPGTRDDLQVWMTLLPDLNPESYLFPSEAGTPLRADNAWKNHVRPRLEPLGLDWVNFQVLRRTNASLSRKANVDDKVSADQRGHGLGVSLGVYAISDVEQKAEAVRQLEAQVVNSGKVRIH